MDTKNFPKDHKYRTQIQLKKLLIKGYKVDPRSVILFLKYGFIVKVGDLWELTQHGIDFINWQYKKTPLERFLDKVEKTDSCWLWKGTANKKGYGAFHLLEKKVMANKVSYLFFRGQIPEDHSIKTTCKNPRCVNPDHLVLKTKKR